MELGTENYIKSMNTALKDFLSNAFKVFLKSPRLAFFIYKLLRKQRKASTLRTYWEDKGVHVPPYMIASITSMCNLKCKGCYAKARHSTLETELSQEQWIKIFREAGELGVSVIMLAGGEPFSRKDIFDITMQFHEIVFPVFTNGMLINDGAIAKMKAQKNMIPIISIEGYEQDTDDRRGRGVYEYTKHIMEKLKKAGIIFGTSLTVTSRNFKAITGPHFIESLLDSGCRLLFYIEYVAVEEGTADMILSDNQREELSFMMEEFHSKYKGLFVAFPGDEKNFGGCLAAGRGFVHVGPEGSLEPCPFSPYSDVSLKDSTLKDALKSEFLKKIREDHKHLSETEGGCTLFKNKEWVQSLLHNEGEGGNEKIHTNPL